jgi:hypothetical protein
MSCSVVKSVVGAGAAVECTSVNCGGLRPAQGPAGTTEWQRWVAPVTTIVPSSDPSADFLMKTSTGYWQTVGEVDARNPDYTQFSISFNPLLGGLAGLTGTVTIDRYGGVHATVAVNLGKGYWVGGSYTYGYINGPTQPGAEDLDKFFKGTGCSAGGGAGFLGKTVEWSGGVFGHSYPIFMTPQAGISCGYTF